jgi:hypothetical protein
MGDSDWRHVGVFRLKTCADEEYIEVMETVKILLACLLTLGVSRAHCQQVPRDRVRTWEVKGLPFCALILREFTEPGRGGFEQYLIMDPDQITRENLKILFKALSDQHSGDANFQAWVYSDVSQLAGLATQSGSGDDSSLNKHKWAYYSRSREREYFDFKPSLSASDLTTVVLRGDP